MLTSAIVPSCLCALYRAVCCTHASLWFHLKSFSWPACVANALKACSSQRKGIYVKQECTDSWRQRVVASARIPRNWKKFLHVDLNKGELFSFLSKALVVEVSQTPKRITPMLQHSHELASHVTTWDASSLCTTNRMLSVDSHDASFTTCCTIKIMASHYWCRGVGCDSIVETQPDFG